MDAAGGQGSLIGRERELARLASLLDALVQGNGGVAIVRGEAGIGKSSVLAELQRRAREQGIAVLAVEPQEIDRRRPLGALIDALELERAAPHAEASLHSVDRRVELGIAESILGPIAERAEAGPLLVAVDDLHWADDASLVALDRLARRTAALPILLVATCRPLPLPEALRALLSGSSGRGDTAIELGPLSDDAVGALVRRLGGHTPEIHERAAAAGGNPLLIEEFLRGAGDGPVAGAGGAGPGERFQAIVRERLLHLPAGSEAFLRVAAVLGASFTLLELAAVLDRSPVDLLRTLDACIVGGLLASEDDRLAFRHQLIREALYHELDPSARAALHREVGSALARRGAPALLVAEHLVRGAQPGDLEAIGWLHRAALSVAPSSASTALALLDQALELLGPGEGERGELLAHRAVCLLWSGRFEEAVSTCAAALALTTDDRSAALHMCRVQALHNLGRLDEALGAAALVVDAPDASPAERSHALGSIAFCQLHLGDRDRAAAGAARAIEASEAAGYDLGLSHAHQVLALARGGAGALTDALASADASTALAARVAGSEGYRLGGQVVRAALLVPLDRVDEALRAAAEAALIADELGNRAGGVYATVATALAHFAAGAWDAAELELAAAAETAAQLGMAWQVTPRGIQAVIAVHRGDLATARAAIASARETPQTQDLHAMLWWLADALVREADDGAAAAVEALTAAWGAWGADRGGLAAVVLAPELTRLALAVGDQSLARAAVAAAELACAAEPTIVTRQAIALRCRGLLEDDPELLLQAVAAHRTVARPLDLALAAEDAAAALARRGRSGEARALLEEACGCYELLGAERDLARASGRLRTAGVRRGPRGPRRVAGGGWESLTHAELRVATLVAEGLSNRQVAARLYLSPHTVHTHVARVLRKLGAGSRTELAAAAAQR